jgi:hypothetical protein
MAMLRVTAKTSFATDSINLILPGSSWGRVKKPYRAVDIAQESKLLYSISKMP